jgi:hypothetical protein
MIHVAGPVLHNVFCTIKLRTLSYKIEFAARRQCMGFSARLGKPIKFFEHAVEAMRAGPIVSGH